MAESIEINGKQIISLIFVVLILLYVWNLTKARLHNAVTSFYQTRGLEDVGHNDRSIEQDEDFIDDSDDDPIEFNNLGVSSNLSIFLFDALSWEGGMVTIRVAIMAILFLVALAIFNYLLTFFGNIRDRSNESIGLEETFNDSASDIYTIISAFATDLKIGLLWIIISSIFVSIYVYFIVPNGDHERGVNDEEATHMHVDIMMFFLLFLLISLLFFAFTIKE